MLKGEIKVVFRGVDTKVACVNDRNGILFKPLESQISDAPKCLRLPRRKLLAMTPFLKRPACWQASMVDSPT